MKQRRFTPEKELRLPLFELGGPSGAVDAAVLAGAFTGLHAGTHMVALFKQLARLPGPGNFDAEMNPFF